MLSQKQFQKDAYFMVHFLFDKILYFCILFQLLYVLAFDDKSISQWIIWYILCSALLIEIFLNFLHIFKHFELKEKSLSYFLCILNLGEIPLLLIKQNQKFDLFAKYRLNFNKLVCFVIEVPVSIALAFLLDPNQFILPLLAYFFPIQMAIASLFEPQIVESKKTLKSAWQKLFLEAIGQIGQQGLVLIYIIHNNQSLITMIIINLGFSAIFLACTAQLIAKHYKDCYFFIFYFIAFFGYFVDIRVPFVLRSRFLDRLQEWQRNLIIFLQLLQIFYVFFQFFIQHFKIFKDESLSFSIQALIILALSIFQIIMKLISLIDNVILSYFKGPKIIRLNSFQQLKDLRKQYQKRKKIFKRLKFLIIQFDLRYQNDGIQNDFQLIQKREQLIQKILFFDFKNTEIIQLQKIYYRTKLSDSKFAYQQVQLNSQLDCIYLQTKIDQGYKILDEIKAVEFNKFQKVLEIIQIFKILYENCMQYQFISNNIFNVVLREKLKQMSKENEQFQLQITIYQKQLSRHFNINPVQILYDLYQDLNLDS